MHKIFYEECFVLSQPRGGGSDRQNSPCCACPQRMNFPEGGAYEVSRFRSLPAAWRQ